jgi:hypothetical protein
VTVKVRKGALSQRDFTFAGGMWQKLDLSDNPLLFGGTNVTDAGIGAINFGGNWDASSVAAGARDTSTGGDLASPPAGLGRNDTLIAGDNMPTLLATIARITVKGAVGGSASDGGHFGVTVQHIRKASLAAFVFTLTGAPQNELLDVLNGDFRLVDFA